MRSTTRWGGRLLYGHYYDGKRPMQHYNGGSLSSRPSFFLKCAKVVTFSLRVLF